MYSASDLKKGLKIEIEKVPYAITEFQFVKPGKGQGMYKCRLRNMLTGATLERTFREVDSFDQPNLEERELCFSYQHGDDFVFSDNRTYEEFHVNGEMLGDNKYFLTENIEVSILFYNDKPVDITMPSFVEKQIVETEPGFKGNTATNTYKAAKIDNGYEIQVPLFIEVGDWIRIDTRTGKYGDRVNKR